MKKQDLPPEKKDEQERELMVQGIVPALEQSEPKPVPDAPPPLYGPPEMPDDELVKKMLQEPMLQGLVQAPNPDLNNMQMTYGPPPMVNNGIGFMGMRIPHWIDDEKWQCSCGAENAGKFCTECGSRAPARPAYWLDDSKWLCACGTENEGKFCAECGAPAPPKLNGDGKWQCSCGAVNTGKFCSECGSLAPLK